MGSRAVVVVCRDEGVARERFGVVDEGVGVVTTRTGRPFFRDAALAKALLDRFRTAIGKADLWTLLDASNQLNSFATLDRALRLILDIAARMTDSQAGSVILLHDGGGDRGGEGDHPA